MDLKPDLKPDAAGAGDDHINLKVRAADGTFVLFKIKRSTPMSKLMKAYCDRASVRKDEMVFLFDGRRLLETETPADLDMDDDDEIDALIHQQGGY